MLAELHIQNIAVIQKATIFFKNGLNVFTGETGAGKTILISAIDAVLGERTSKDIIRSGEEKAQVSALFEDISSEIKLKLETMGFDSPEDNTLLIYREITTSGKNTCRVNGLPANVSILKEISQSLINIHGQRDTGQLISSDQHLIMIDNYGELAHDILEYKTEYKKLRDKENELKSLDMDELEKAQRIDMLNFQIKEIEDAELDNLDEEEELISQKKMALGSEKIRRGLASAYRAYEGDGEIPGLDELFDLFVVGVEKAAEYMDELLPITERLSEINYEFTDIASDIQSTLENFEFDPKELEHIERRLDIIYKLKKKYGSSISEILEYYQNILEEYDTIRLSDKKQEKLEAEITELHETCDKLAKKLSKKRAVACKKFLNEVEKELEYLDMPNVKLSVAHERIPFSSTGTDALEFMIVTNLGEQPKPLAKTASGGELARIMLAIKTVMADKDNINTLIFDEIDTGVSGKAAGKIGCKLAEVSESRQVICVTHLAQVAAFADNHLYIQKIIENDRTFTKVDNLDQNQRIEELARITSGEVITEITLASAQELLLQAERLKTKKG